MRTEKDRERAWRAVNSARSRFDIEYRKQFLKALNLQIGSAVVAIKQGAPNPESFIVEIPILNVFNALYPRVGVSFARSTYRTVVAGKSTSMHYDIKAEEPENDWLRFMRNFVTNKAGSKITNITETTRKFVRGVLDKAAELGLSIENTANLVIKEAKGINKTRAKLIARTEIISASNQGSLIGAESTGIALNKEWLATRDKKTRSSHIGADGQKVALNGIFMVNGSRLLYPGDTSLGADASETIQCRCTQVYNPI